jgi:hypothetical protein
MVTLHTFCLLLPILFVSLNLKHGVFLHKKNHWIFFKTVWFTVGNFWSLMFRFVPVSYAFVFASCHFASFSTLLCSLLFNKYFENNILILFWLVMLYFIIYFHRHCSRPYIITIFQNNINLVSDECSNFAAIYLLFSFFIYVIIVICYTQIWYKPNLSIINIALFNNISKMLMEESEQLY